MKKLILLFLLLQGCATVAPTVCILGNFAPAGAVICGELSERVSK